MTVLLLLLEHRIQSNEEFLVASPLRVVFLRIHVSMVGVRNYQIDCTSNFNAFCRNKKSITSIIIDDNLYPSRSLVVAVAFKEDSHTAKTYFKSIRLERANRNEEHVK